MIYTVNLLIIVPNRIFDCNYRCKVLGVKFKDIPTPADFDDLAEVEDAEDTV